MILPPHKRTFARWRKLSGTQFSVLRGLEYERIEGLRLKGLVLDVGGGVRNSYLPLLNVEGSVESVNIDPTMQPTYLADLNAPLPIPSDRYDALISLNTLEHIADDRTALSEMCRVLKPGGVAHLIVPFLYRVHGSPNDYHRHTASAWERMLAEAGFAPDTVSIEPLAFGGLASAFSLAEFMFPKPVRWFLKKTAMLMAVLRNPEPNAQFDVPLGYYIVAQKRDRR